MEETSARQLAMRAAANHLIVQPTGDNDESERGRIIVVNNERPQHKIWRGVVLDVGFGTDRYDERAEVGMEVHYNAFHEIAEKHIVPITSVIAWGD